MREKYFNVDFLIKVQQITWYLVICYFALVFALMILSIEAPVDLISYGVVLILAATGVKLIVMAEQFRMSGLKRFWILSYLLVLILVAVVIQRYFA